jgi:putative ABC transport system permease protein
VFRKLSWWLRRQTREAELDEELQSYLDEEAEERRAEGLTPEEAYRAARMELGNVALVKEDTRAAWSWIQWEQLLRDLRHTFRLLRRDIRLNVVIVCTIALGIAANTTMFSIVNAILLKSPVPEPERLIVINETHSPDSHVSSVSIGNFLEWQKASTSFQSMAASLDRRFTLREGNETESIWGELVTASYFATLGVRPQLGRWITPGEEQAGRSDLVLISRRLWMRRFGGDPDFLGRTINLDSRPHSVIGVLEIEPTETDIWIPMAFNEADGDNRESPSLTVFGRLARGVSVADASTELKQIARHLEPAVPGTNQGWSVLVTPFNEGTDALAYLLFLLWGAAGFVLLTVCANIANLLLSRSISRRREVAIRMAIGATRLQIVRQLLTESIVLALIGGAAGLLLMYWGIRTVNVLGSDVLPIRIRIEPMLLGFTALLSVATALIFGLAPALALTNSNIGDRVGDGLRSASTGRRERLLRRALVAAEVSVSLVLLIGAGLMMRSFVKLASVNPGFNAANVLVAELTLPERKYADPDQMRRFTNNVLQELSSLRGVTAVAASHVLPFSSSSTDGVTFEGQNAVSDPDTPLVHYFAVSPQYFEALEIPLMRGRVFTKEDVAGSRLVTIINETFASRFFPNESAIGKRIRVTSARGMWREIVGVVGDTKQQSLNAMPAAQVYEPLDQMPFSFITFIVKTTGNPMSLASAVERRVQDLDAEQSVSIRPLAEIIKESVFPIPIVMAFLAVFAGAALLIASTGVYGVTAYSVSRRTGEIGLRMALGSDRRRLLAMVLREGMFPVAIGLIFGITVAVGLSQILRGLLFQTSATDVLTYVGSSALLAVVGLFACYIPARRALRVDPMVVLRHE